MRSNNGLQAALRRRIVPGILALGLLVAPIVASPAGADQLGDKQAQAQQVADKLDQLQSKVMNLNGQVEQGKAELDRANAAVDDAQQQVDAANAELDQRRSELQKYAVQAYVTGNDAPGVEAMLTSEGDVAPQKRGYIEAASGNRQDLLDEIESTKRKAEDEGARLADAQNTAEARNQQIQSSLNEAQSASDEQEKIKSKIDGEVATLVAEDQKRKADEAEKAAAEQARQQAATQAAAPKAASPAAASPTAPSAAPSAPVVSAPPPPVGSGAGAAVAAAMSRIGMPYIWAASGPSSFDCSGLTMWAWGQAGLSLPHYSGAQWAMARPVSVDAAQPGDLVFFWAPGDSGDPGHVGMYIGGGTMVHAPGTGRSVTTNSIYYWPGARMAIGRVG